MRSWFLAAVRANSTLAQPVNQFPGHERIRVIGAEYLLLVGKQRLEQPQRLGGISALVGPVGSSMRGRERRFSLSWPVIDRQEHRLAHGGFSLGRWVGRVCAILARDSQWFGRRGSRALRRPALSGRTFPSSSPRSRGS